MLVYSSLLAMVLVLGAPYWLAQMVTSGRYRAGLAGRLGRVPAALRAACSAAHGAGQDVVWVHAVSVGEVLAAARLVEELRQAMPGVVVAVSTTTATGQALAQQRFAEGPVFYLPLDFGFLMRRYLRVLQPKLLVLMESELWPNMIRACSQAGVPVAVANARVSDRSFPRYMRLRRIWGPLLREVAMFLAQSEETAGRLQTMGVAAERVVVAGNLKYDVRTPPQNRVAAMIREVAGERLILVAGSTLDRATGRTTNTMEKTLSEDAMLLQAWEGSLRRSGVMLVLAPRHPQRFAEVEAMAGEFKLIKASELEGASKGREADSSVSPRNDRQGCVGGTQGAAGKHDVEIVLLNTIGDLAAVYGVADVAFVGGSLVARGGHNPLEPAQFGVPVVMGESYENFRGIVETMRAAEAVRIVTADELAGALAELLEDAAGAKALGERGRRVFLSQAGATARVVRELMELLRLSSEKQAGSGLS